MKRDTANQKLRLLFMAFVLSVVLYVAIMLLIVFYDYHQPITLDKIADWAFAFIFMLFLIPLVSFLAPHIVVPVLLSCAAIMLLANRWVPSQFLLFIWIPTLTGTLVALFNIVAYATSGV